MMQGLYDLQRIFLVFVSRMKGFGNEVELDAKAETDDFNLSKYLPTNVDDTLLT